MPIKKSHLDECDSRGYTLSRNTDAYLLQNPLPSTVVSSKAT